MKRFVRVLVITAGITGLIGGIGETAAHATKRSPEGGSVCTAIDVVNGTPAVDNMSPDALSHLVSLCDGDGGGGGGGQKSP